MKRILYLGYYIKKLNYPLFKKFLDFAKKQTGKMKISILFDMLISIFKFNISILEYFQFRFFELNTIQRKNWAGTGFMYEYQLLMNPLSQRVVLDNKILFYEKFKNYFVHRIFSRNDLLENINSWDYFTTGNSDKIVFKTKDGKCGTGVLIRSKSEFKNLNDVNTFMAQNEFDILEEFVVQHSTIQKLSPSAVNTVRIFTQLNSKNEVEILGCRLRISVNSAVDNMAAGNLAAPIDETTGIVNGVGVYSDITKSACTHHPITGIAIIGFQVPFWKETLDLVKKAAIDGSENRSIGWDIVITEKGPGLIEGNHDWCKLLWQLPVKQGLKSNLLKYLN